MRKIVHFVGMKRFGNHAVIPWVQKNAFSEADNGAAFHINDVYPAYMEHNNLSRPPGMSVVSSNPNILAIVSYEDLPLELIPRLPTVVQSDFVLPDATVETMLLLRDPFNAFASRLKRLRDTQEEGFQIAEQKQEWAKTTELWKSYAREYLGYTEVLGGITPVNFNRWVSEKGYRDRLLRVSFGREENLDIGIDEVGRYGYGSSFRRFDYDGRAREMDVLGSWKNFQDDNFYRSLFQDRELVGLSQEIFGHLSGTEILQGNPYGKETR